VGIFNAEAFSMNSVDSLPPPSPLRFEGMRDIPLSRSELAAFFESASIGLKCVGPDGTILWANEAELALLGYPWEEYVGQPLSLFHADADVITDILERLIQGEKLCDYEARLKHKDGSLRIVLIRSSVHWLKGQFVHSQCFTTDITERKRVEAELIERARLVALRGDVNLALASAHSLHEVLQRCADALVIHLDAALVRIWTLNEAEDTLELQATAGISPALDAAQDHVKVAEDQVIGRVAQQALPMVSHNVQDDPRLSDLDWARPEGITAFAGYPLLLNGHVLGVLGMFAGHVLSDSVLSELDTLASGLSQWMQRKRAEEDLHATVDLNPQSPWTANADGSLKSFSDRWLLLTGLNVAAALNGGWMAAVHLGDRPTTAAAWLQAVQTGEPYDLEHRIRLADGEYRWMRSRAYPRRDALGRIQRWYGTTEDIHEHRTAAFALFESEERYRTLMESSPDCIKVLDGEGRLQHMNSNGMCLMEIDDFSIFKDKEWWELWGEANIDIVKQAVKDAMGGKAAQFQAFCPTAKGTPKWWDVVVAAVEGDKKGERPQRLISVSRDITFSKQYEEALSVSEARFRAIVSQVTTGVVEADKEGRMTFVNQQWCEMIGYSEVELQGMRISDLTVPLQLEESLRRLKKLLDTGVPFQLEIRYQRKDGTTFWANCNVNAVRGPDASITGIVAVILDTTERRAAEEELRAAKEEAELASQAKDNFLASLSHELRTPLNPVLMTAASLCEDESLTPHIREQLAMIERNVALEARLIDDMLDITRISRGKLTLRPESCDVNSLIGLVEEIIREEALEKQIQIEVDLSASHSRLIGDPTRLQQVFWNLLRNAVKFTHAGGRIQIRSYNGETAENIGTERVYVEVSDTGIGLDAAAISRIFQPFEQVKLGEHHRFGGLGLGLSIAKAVVDLHQGTLLASSAGHGKGSTFTVSFPVTATVPLVTSPSAPLIGDGESDPSAAEQPMRLLVVEDHVATLQVLTRLLMRAGHHVCGVGTLAEAHAAAASSTFDAVISDLGLPDGTGLELMISLRQLYNLRGVVLSGYGMEEDLRRSREAGFVAHLVKPINVKELRRVLQQFSTHKALGA
jgi:PAS domain S-box-containing protein